MASGLSPARLSEMFSEGADRKAAERERFAALAFERPERYDFYVGLTEYLELDIRYYRLAAAYYRGDIDSLDTGAEEDLLLLTEASEPSPRAYAMYLREIGQDAKDEKATHKALLELKAAIRSALRGGP